MFVDVCIFTLCTQSYCTTLQYIAYMILLTCENVCDIDYCMPLYCDIGDIAQPYTRPLAPIIKYIFEIHLSIAVG